MEMQIYSKVRELEQYILAVHGLVIDTEVRLDLKGRAAGQALFYLDTQTYIMRLNLEAGLDFLLSDTIPHEMAHLLQSAFGSKMDHGRAWEAYCKELGGTGLQYHELNLTPARKTREFLYVVNGKEFIMSTIRHNKMQKKGITYADKSGNQITAHNFVQEITNES